MKAMIFEYPGQPLQLQEVEKPVPEAGQVLVKVEACGVCRTDLHIVDGELQEPKVPLIPGHEIIGEVMETGNKVQNLQSGDLVGIPWLGYTCGKCKYCRRDQENLCENALLTGYTMDGGYAEYTVAYENFCFPLPDKFRDYSMAPLLCAGLIGFRSYRMIDEYVENIGFYGFGAAAHILIQMASTQGKRIYAFTREGDQKAQKLALDLGAVWAGSSKEPPSDILDAAIIFAPVGPLVPESLRHLDKGGSVICGGIHMSDIPAFPYELLWHERNIQSVANLTREDATGFLKAIDGLDIHTKTRFYDLEHTNEALNDLREGHIQGAAVLKMV